MNQIGWKIFYNLSDGTIVHDIGERQGLVNKTSNIEDFPDYNPSIHGIIELTFGKRTQDIVNKGSWEIVNGQLVIHPSLTISSDKTQVTGDGVDTASLTIQLPDPVSQDVVLSVDGTSTTLTTDATGKAAYGFSSSLTGEYTITATNPTYGQNSAIVGVV